MSWKANQRFVIRICNQRTTEKISEFFDASNKFNTIEQGQKTVQELIQELTKYAAWMVQYLDDYSFRRQLIAALRPSL